MKNFQNSSWFGVEVKAGVTVNVNIGVYNVINISNASYEGSMGWKRVNLFLWKQEQRFCIGSFSHQNLNLECKLSFNDSFKLSHNGKSGSIFISGHKQIFQENVEAYGEDEHNLMDTSDDEGHIIDPTSSDDDETDQYDTDEDAKLKWPQMKVFAATPKKDKCAEQTSSSGKKGGGQTSSSGKKGGGMKGGGQTSSSGKKGGGKKGC